MLITYSEQINWANIKHKKLTHLIDIFKKLSKNCPLEHPKADYERVFNENWERLKGKTTLSNNEFRVPSINKIIDL